MAAIARERLQTDLRPFVHRQGYLGIAAQGGPARSTCSVIDSAPRLADAVRALEGMGASRAKELFDRERLGPAQANVLLGPPWRPEFNAISNPEIRVINLAACSYLGLASDARVRSAAVSALETYGTQAGGARPLSGTTRAHFELEAKLACLLGAGAAATFSSGYLANISTIVGLFGAGDQILLDRNAHRSLYDGALLSGAQVRRFHHNDPRHLDRLLNASSATRRRLVVVDGIYSMDGDIALIPELLDVVRKHRAFLLVDEAHSFGVLGARGAGVTEHFGVDPKDVHLRTGSLNKAIPAAGGFLVADREVILLLRYTSAGGAFSGALAPTSVVAADAALDALSAEPSRIDLLRRNSEDFRVALRGGGVEPMGDATPIVSIPIGDPGRTLAAASAVLDRGVYLNAIIAPGVRRGGERLRCFVSAEHSASDLQYAAEVICEAVRRAH